MPVIADFGSARWHLWCACGTRRRACLGVSDASVAPADFIHDMALSPGDAPLCATGVELLEHIANFQTQHWVPASAARVVCALAAVRVAVDTSGPAGSSSGGLVAAERLLLRGLGAGSLGVISRHDSVPCDAAAAAGARAAAAAVPMNHTEALLSSRWLRSALLDPALRDCCSEVDACASSRRRAIITALVSNGVGVSAALRAARDAGDDDACATRAHAVLAAVALADEAARREVRSPADVAVLHSNVVGAGALREALLAAHLDVGEALRVARRREEGGSQPHWGDSLLQCAVVGMGLLAEWTLETRKYVPTPNPASSAAAGCLSSGGVPPPPAHPPMLRASSSMADGDSPPSTWTAAGDLVGGVLTSRAVLNLLALCACLPTAASKAALDAVDEARLEVDSPLLRVRGDSFAPRVLAAVVRGTASSDGILVDMAGAHADDCAAARELVWRHGRRILERAPRIADPYARALLCCTAASCVGGVPGLLLDLHDDEAIDGFLLVCVSLRRWERGAYAFCRTCAGPAGKRREWPQFFCRTCAPEEDESGAARAVMCPTCAIVFHSGHSLVADAHDGSVCAATSGGGRGLLGDKDVLARVKSAIARPGPVIRVLQLLSRSSPTCAFRTSVVEALGCIVQWAGVDVEVAGSEGLCGTSSLLTASTISILRVGGAVRARARRRMTPLRLTA